jgi:sugar/nucleoside kinase (ribokinase family)
MTDITVIGDVFADLRTSPISSYPKKDLQMLVPTISLEVGGAATFALAASRLGLKTRIIGLIGKDIFGEFILKKTKEFKIDAKLKQTSREKTAITLGIHFKDGSKSLLTCLGTNSVLSTKDFRSEDLEGRAVYVGGYNFLDNLRKDFYGIIKYAKKEGMLVCLDPDLKSRIRFSVKEIKKLMKIIDIFFVDMEEGEVLTGKKEKIEIFKNLLKFGCKIVALKCGNNGCVVGSKEKIFEIEGIEVEPVNPTGTGDVFNAAFIFRYLKTRNVNESGIFANAAGALAVSSFGDKRFASEKETISFSKKKY